MGETGLPDPTERMGVIEATEAEADYDRYLEGVQRWQGVPLFPTKAMDAILRNCDVFDARRFQLESEKGTWMMTHWRMAAALPPERQASVLHYGDVWRSKQSTEQTWSFVISHPLIERLLTSRNDADLTTHARILNTHLRFTGLCDWMDGFVILPTDTFVFLEGHDYDTYSSHTEWVRVAYWDFEYQFNFMMDMRSTYSWHRGNDLPVSVIGTDAALYNMPALGIPMLLAVNDGRTPPNCTFVSTGQNAGWSILGTRVRTNDYKLLPVELVERHYAMEDWKINEAWKREVARKNFPADRARREAEAARKREEDERARAEAEAERERRRLEEAQRLREAEKALEIAYLQGEEKKQMDADALVARAIIGRIQATEASTRLARDASTRERKAREDLNEATRLRREAEEREIELNKARRERLEAEEEIMDPVEGEFSLSFS